MTANAIALIITPFISSQKAGLLFAARLFEASRSFRGGTKFNLTQLVAFAIAAIVLIALCVFTPRLYDFWQRARSRSPRVLFLELCKLHSLRPETIRLLEDLSVARKLSHPAIVFVDPNQFNSAGLPQSLNGRHHELKALRDRLFESNEGNSAPRR